LRGAQPIKRRGIGCASPSELRLVANVDRPWGMRDFVIIDPTGVLWRIGQNIPAGRDGQSDGP